MYQRFEIPKLASRQPDCHKGDFGRSILIGGSRGMSGAISIAALASLRSGAGWVTACVPDPILELVASIHPCLMTISLLADEQGRLSYEAIDRISQLTEQATCLAIGPGLGRSNDINRLLFMIHQETACPLVVDADGLFALAAIRNETPSIAELNPHRYPRVWTPHAGEFERLTGVSAKDRNGQINAAHELARTQSIVIVLKGQHTLVTNGVEFYVNQSGNPKMATGGSGDCLTGIVNSLICQSLSGFEAAILGVHLHGLAGDLAANQTHAPNILATDIIDQLGNAFEKVIDTQ